MGAAEEHAPVQDVNSAIISEEDKIDKNVKDLFLTYHCFCKRKDVGFGALFSFTSSDCRMFYLHYYS